MKSGGFNMKKIIAVCLISILATSYAGQGITSIKPEERDRSGKFDGGWIVSAHIKRQSPRIGDTLLTCNENNFSFGLNINDGRLTIPGLLRSDGYIKEDGTLEANGKLDKIDIDRRLIFSGQLSGDKGEGKVVITYEHPTKGCKGTVNFLMVKLAPVKPPDTISESDTQKLSVYDYYGEAEEEVNTKTYDKNLWARAFVKAEGDEQKRKAKYIELRANQLYSENVSSISKSNLNEQPVSGTDISGTYVSDIRGGTSWQFSDRKLMITFKQNGNDIIGTNDSQIKMITGTRKGDTIKFEYYASNFTITGEWKINHDGTKLEGTWDSGGDDGKWSLGKIE